MPSLTPEYVEALLPRARRAAHNLRGAHPTRESLNAAANIIETLLEALAHLKE